jgi:hypothetical protein
MFKTCWFKPGVIASDEGFSVLPKRDRLTYREGKRSMTISIDMGGNEFTIFVGTIARWDDDPSNSVASETRKKITDNIRRALESQGQKVNFVSFG